MERTGRNCEEIRRTLFPIERKNGSAGYPLFSRKRTEPELRTPESRIKSNDSVATSSYAPKMVKLDFPRFDEKEDATSWICRAEQFFQFHHTPDEDRVGIASFHMVGDAQLWYQLLKQENPVVT